MLELSKIDALTIIAVVAILIAFFAQRKADKLEGSIKALEEKVKERLR